MKIRTTKAQSKRANNQLNTNFWFFVSFFGLWTELIKNV